VKLEDRRDEIADPLLLAAFEDLRQEMPEGVDWGGLRAAINDRAALPLARRRARRGSFINRRFLPVAIAASVAFALWAGPGIYDQALGPRAGAAAAAIDSEEILVRALGSDISEYEFRLLVTGRANPEVLLAVAVGTR
jgi:hypothetical protein